MRRKLTVLVVLLLAGFSAPGAVAAQVRGAALVRVPDSATTQVVRLRDGSTLIGRFVNVEGDQLIFETAAGRLTLRRADLIEVREVSTSSMRGGRYWHPDPNPTRLYFGPTARSLPKGEADFSDTYLFFLSGAYGLGSNLQIGAGMSVFPFDDFSDNLFFVTAKAGIEVDKSVHLAVGGLLGWAGTFDDDIGGDGLGTFYGVGTFGSDDHSLTAALVVPYVSGDLTDPVVMLGGETRIHRNIKLVTENYISTHRETEAILGYGLRIFNEKISVGLAFLNSTEEGIFPGLPYVDFVVRF